MAVFGQVVEASYETFTTPPASDSDIWQRELSPSPSIDGGKEKDVFDTSDISAVDISLLEGEPDEESSLAGFINEAHTDRERKVKALLFRAETIDLFEALYHIHESTMTKQDMQRHFATKIFHSSEHLHAFAELVTEDLIAIDEGKIIVTAFCQRLLQSLADM
jgi:hypothetical protein